MTKLQIIVINAMYENDLETLCNQALDKLATLSGVSFIKIEQVISSSQGYTILISYSINVSTDINVTNTYLEHA